MDVLECLLCEAHLTSYVLPNQMGLVLRHMDGSYSTDLTLLLVSQGNLACTGSNPQLAQNSLDMMGTEGLLQYLSTSDVRLVSDRRWACLLVHLGCKP